MKMAALTRVCVSMLRITPRREKLFLTLSRPLFNGISSNERIRNIDSQIYLRRWYGSGASLTEQNLIERTINVVKLFDKVNPDKVIKLKIFS